MYVCYSWGIQKWDLDLEVAEVSNEYFNFFSHIDQEFKVRDYSWKYFKRKENVRCVAAKGWQF